jgi:hypothetical protein
LHLLGPHDQPNDGHRYDVFYNKSCVGLIETVADWNYSTENPRVVTAIEITDARLLFFGEVLELLYIIGELMSGSAEDYARVRRDALIAMAAAQWDQSPSQVLWASSELKVELHLSLAARRYIAARKTAHSTEPNV